MPLSHTGKELTAAAILRSEAIDLSSDEDLADDALEQLIKSKEEAEIFNDLPLFDVTSSTTSLTSGLTRQTSALKICSYPLASVSPSKAPLLQNLLLPSALLN